MPDRGRYAKRAQRARADPTRIPRRRPKRFVRVMKGIGRALVGAAPNLITAAGTLAGPKGAVISKQARDLFGSITGRGKYVMSPYKVNQNSIVNGSAQVPTMRNDNGITVVRHREYVQDLSTAIEFTGTTFRINPANAQLFPWLSALAQNFEQYEFMGLVVEWKSLSADALNSTNTALGSVSLATQYNSLDSPFVNKQQVLNYQFATSCKPSESMLHPIECAPNQTPNQPLYIRLGGQSPIGDDRLYDLGIINFCAVGSQAAAVAGEFWVTYEVRLIKPRISSGLGLALRSAMYSLSVTGASLIGADNPMGTVATSQFDSIGMRFEFPAASATVHDGLMTFPVGSEGLYLIYFSNQGDGTTVAAAQSTGGISLSECSQVSTLFNVWGGGTGTARVGPNPAVTGCKSYTLAFFINIPDPNLQASVQFSYGAGWVMANNTSTTVANMVVLQCNGNMLPSVAALAAGHFAAPAWVSDDDEKEDGGQFLTAEEPVDDDYVHEGEETGGPLVVAEKKVRTAVQRPARLPRTAAPSLSRPQ